MKLSRYQNLASLLSDKHKEAIADYVDQEIVRYDLGEQSKLETMLKHCALNVEEGISSFHKHRLFSVNPKVKDRVDK